MNRRSKLPARWREYYNDLLYWPAKLNSWRWFLTYRLRGMHYPSPILVNLGAGKDYRLGYINVDINLWFRRDLWLDLRNPLPFPTGSIDGIFCSHVLEHFTFDETLRIVKGCYRALKPGGVLRVVVPTFEPAITAYLRGDSAYFHAKGESLGRRFCDHVLDSSNHRLMFDYGFMEELLKEAGFQTIKQVAFHKANDPLSQHMAELDNREDISLFVEARR